MVFIDGGEDLLRVAANLLNVGAAIDPVEKVNLATVLSKTRNVKRH